MPSGAKKRKALKKKKQQEAIGTSENNQGFNGNNLRGQDEHGSQDERESDSNLSSPGSQGNEDPSAALSKVTAKEISGDADVTHGLEPNSGNAIAAERRTDYHIAEETPNSFSENVPGDSTLKIAPPVVDSIKPVVSVSEVVISEKSEQAETTTTHSNLVTQKKSDVNEEYPSPGLEKDNNKVVTLPDTAAETSQKVESSRKPQVPEEKHLAHGAPAVRNSPPVVDSIRPVVSVSEVVISEKSEHTETTTHSNLANHKSATAAETSKKVESARKPQVPEEKNLLVPGPQAVRTSWLSCCGLFDAMTGSDR